MPKAVVLIGPPGCGKSDMREKLTEEGYVQIVMSTLIGERLEIDNTILTAADFEMAESEVMTDEILIGIMADHLDTVLPEKSVVIDGFPKTKHQAEFLFYYLRVKKYKLIVIILGLSDAECRKRMESKGKGGNGSVEVASEIHNNHLRDYRHWVAEVQGYFKRRAYDVLHQINVNPPQRVVYREIKRIIDL